MPDGSFMLVAKRWSRDAGTVGMIKEGLGILLYLDS